MRRVDDIRVAKRLVKMPLVRKPVLISVDKKTA
jgi:hypothetical protein